MWFALALASGLFQVSRNMVMKRIGHSMDSTINVWGRFSLVLPFAAIATAWYGVPEIGEGFWGLCFLFGCAQTVATLSLSKALELSDISMVTALWKLSLVMLAVWGFFWLGETPSPMGVVGIVVSLLGVYLLNTSKSQTSLLAPFVALVQDPGQRFTLVSAALYAPCVIMMKQIVTLSDAPFGVLMSYLFATVIITPYAIYKSADQFPRIRFFWREFLVMGVLATGTILTSAIAYTLTLSTYVEAVKQVEILFALGIGWVVFHERGRVREIWPGALAILVGAILIKIWG